jgi:predicted flap endonuclease-1-like 5' DNA nuclease
MAMAISVTKLRGMSEDLKDLLNRHGVFNNEQLLRAARTPADRSSLGKRLELPADALTNLANRADLCRITGIGGVYSDMLELAGVDTVPELANRRFDNLHKRLTQINEEREMTSKPPTIGMVKEWIFQANEIPRRLVY